MPSQSRAAAVSLCLRGLIVAATLTVVAVAAIMAFQPAVGL